MEFWSNKSLNHFNLLILHLESCSMKTKKRRERERERDSSEVAEKWQDHCSLEQEQLAFSALIYCKEKSNLVYIKALFY